MDHLHTDLKFSNKILTAAILTKFPWNFARESNVFKLLLWEVVKAYLRVLRVEGSTKPGLFYCTTSHLSVTLL